MEEAEFSLEELIAGGRDNFRVIEEQIDVETQAVYFRYSQKVRANAEAFSHHDLYGKLQDATVSVKEKKKLLANLAARQNVEAYRMLESYVKQAEPVLKDWAILAYNESRMFLENSLGDEQQIFISTGMGGKGTKLRYFMVLFSASKEGFGEFEKKFVADELSFTFQQNKSVIEQLNLESDAYITLTGLIPVKTSVQHFMRQVFGNCNQLGNFIDQKFIVSNIKAMTRDEIMDFYLGNPDK